MEKQANTARQIKPIAPGNPLNKVLDITGPTYSLWEYGDGTYRMTTTEVASMRKLNKITGAYSVSVFQDGDEPIFKLTSTQLVPALKATLGLRATKRLLKENGVSWQGKR